MSNRSEVTESDITGGQVERQVRQDIAGMGALTGSNRTMAQICYALARALDDPELPGPAAVARELATRLADLERAAGGREESAGDRIAAELADELAPRRRAIPPASA